MGSGVPAFESHQRLPWMLGGKTKRVVAKGFGCRILLFCCLTGCSTEEPKRAEFDAPEAAKQTERAPPKAPASAKPGDQVVYTIAHGGTLRAESAGTAQGSTFVLELPIS